MPRAHFVSCHLPSCHVRSCRVISPRAVPCIMSCLASCHIMSHIVSLLLVSCHAVSCCDIQYLSEGGRKGVKVATENGSWSQKRMNHFRCSVALLLTTRQETRQVHKQGRQDPSYEAMPNNVKTANHLQAEHNEATNSLHKENLPRRNLKGERQRQSQPQNS